MASFGHRVRRRWAPRNKHTQYDAGPISIKRYQEGALPDDLPDTAGLRATADYLEHLLPASDALALVRARDYTGAHELAGIHEAISTIRQWADEMDEINRQQEATQAPAL